MMMEPPWLVMYKGAPLEIQLHNVTISSVITHPPSKLLANCTRVNPLINNANHPAINSALDLSVQAKVLPLQGGRVGPKNQ